MKKTLIVVTLSLIALLLLGIAAAYAQDPGVPGTPPFGGHMGGRGGMMGRGMMNGRGMMGGQGMMGGFGTTHFAAAAEALGLDETTLTEALQSGKTLSEIAEEQGVELADLEAALLTDSEAHVAALLEAGTITQEQADWMLENMRTNLAGHLEFMFSGMGQGYGMGFGYGNCPMWQGE